MTPEPRRQRRRVIERPESGGHRWYDRKPHVWRRAEESRLHMGHVLYARRKQLGLSQQDVADRADVDRDTVRAFEKGLGRVPVVMVFRLMDAVGIEASVQLRVRPSGECGTGTPFAAPLE